ncbi:MAG: restriction endonuclease subunit S [Woeseiaceae bacterium]
MSETAIKQDNQQNWQFLPIKDFAHTTSGGTPKRGIEEYYNGDVPWVKSGDLNDSQLNSVDEFITQLGLEKSSAKLFKSGTLLIALYGATIGRLSILNFEAASNQAVCGITLPENMDVKYVFYYLLSIRRKLISQGKGGAQPNINQQIVKETIIPLAPPEQQKRIVAKIEELFSHIDTGIEALKKAKQLLKQYRQSVLKAAVTGELTKDWREANKNKLEPASQLLERIEKKKLEVYEEEVNKWNELTKKWGESDNKEKKPGKPKISKNIEPLSDEEIGELHSLPAGWLWVKLSQVATKITDGEHFKPPVQDDGVYFLSAKDVRDEGVSFANPLYISDETAAKALLRCNPESGDILIVSRGATVGRMCVVNTDEVFCLLGSVILIKGANGINSEYLMNLMKSPDVNRKISTVSGATAQQAIYLRDIQHVAIPLCSLEEQEEIDLAVNKKTEAIFRLEKEIYTKLAMAEKNKQSILASAFSGNIS